MIAVSRAPLEKLQAFKKRMGWSFKWVSSINNDFYVSFTTAELKKGTVYYNYTDREFPGTNNRARTNEKPSAHNAQY